MLERDPLSKHQTTGQRLGDENPIPINGASAVGDALARDWVSIGHRESVCGGLEFTN